MSAVLILVAALSASTSLALEPCMECHSKTGFAIDKKHLWFEHIEFKSSVHGGLICKDCHKGVERVPHKNHRVRCIVACHVKGASHDKVGELEESSAHAFGGELSCLGCHNNNLIGDAAVDSCVGCHGGMEEPLSFFPAFTGALGYRAHLLTGEEPLDCVDCHGSHGISSGEQARTSCGRSERCHPGKDDDFAGLFSHTLNASEAENLIGGWKVFGGLGLFMTVLLCTTLMLHVIRRR